MSISAGWYPDHASVERLRWWDGNAWTEYYAPLPTTLVPVSNAESHGGQPSTPSTEGVNSAIVIRDAQRQQKAAAPAKAKSERATVLKQAKTAASDLKRRQKAAERKNRVLERELSDWTSEHKMHSGFADLAHNYDGGTTDAIMLKAGERAFYSYAGAALIEFRAGARHYSGRSSGVSVPIGFGMRARVGQSRGRITQDPPRETPVDVGQLVITNQRIVFRGAKATRECLFTKLVGYDIEDDGDLTVSVSNRQKPTQVRVQRSSVTTVSFYVALALSHFNGSIAERCAELDKLVADHEAQRPRLLPVPIS